MFFNETGQGPPSITQNFTERLRDFFLQNTQLTLAPANGDLVLEGTISGYDFRPVTPTASGNENTPDVAAQQRLTVTVSATYINTVDDSFNFENKRFSHYYDYDPDQGDITTIEDQALEEIFQVIIFEIFNATVANW